MPPRWRRCAPLLSEFGADAPPRAGRGRVVHRAVGRRLREFKPLSEAARGLLRGLVTALLGSRCAGDQGHREDHQPRREGGRVLAEVALRRPRRADGGRRVRALRLHQRGHQQHQPRADAEGARATRCCCRRSIASSRPCARWRIAVRRACRCCRARMARPRARPRSARKSPTWRRGWPRRARRIAGVQPLAKMNGAVGNYNAHLAA